MRYQRILLKLSGESLGGARGTGYDPVSLERYCGLVRTAFNRGIELAIVVGGGNLFRGSRGLPAGFSRTRGDQMGMLATSMNGIALTEMLNCDALPAIHVSSIDLSPWVDLYTIDRAKTSMASGRIVVISGGTGNPFFTTDSAAALRAAELQCDLLLKATRVDGVYSEDPEVNPNALKYSRITFDQAYQQGLKIMDMTAFTLCRENDIPLIVCNVFEPDAIERILDGESVGTLIEND